MDIGFRGNVIDDKLAKVAATEKYTDPGPMEVITDSLIQNFPRRIAKMNIKILVSR